MTKSETLAVDLIIQSIKSLYGYDFSNYNQASLTRRLNYHKSKNDFEHLIDILPRLLKDPLYFNELLCDISVTVTEMFRFPDFYKAFTQKVIPLLQTHPYFNIWHAGCSSGQEVYSMAILLHEHQLLSRARIYGTDFNPYALETAKSGIYSQKEIATYIQNYEKISQQGNFKEYISEKYDAFKMKSFLQERALFSLHNLVSDKSFTSAQVIICRNVLIYFNHNLKQRVYELFSESLAPFGFLCLGEKERFDSPDFKCIDEKTSIYQKVKS